MTNKNKTLVPVSFGFSDIEPSQDYYWDSSGNKFSVARLWDAAKDLKPFDLPLMGLDLTDKIWDDSNIFQLAWHVKKVQESDLNIPILLDWYGAIADGRHRIIKAIIEDKVTIKAVRIQWKMEPCALKDEDEE